VALKRSSPQQCAEALEGENPLRDQDGANGVLAFLCCGHAFPSTGGYYNDCVKVPTGRQLTWKRLFLFSVFLLAVYK